MIERYGELFAENDEFIVYKAHGNLYMYFKCGDGAVAGTLLSGVEGFQRKYKGDLDRWVTEIRKREKKTMESYRMQAQQLNALADEIAERNGWNNEKD